MAADAVDVGAHGGQTYVFVGDPGIEVDRTEPAPVFGDPERRRHRVGGEHELDLVGLDVADAVGQQLPLGAAIPARG